MQVILQSDIAGLGLLGEQVSVKPGYGRNFLIPKGLAAAATADNLKIFEARRAELERQAASILALAEERAEKIKDLVIHIQAKASEESKLFGSVAAREIVEAASLQGIELHRTEVILLAGPIRVLGEHEVHLRLHSRITLPIKLNITAI